MDRNVLPFLTPHGPHPLEKGNPAGTGCIYFLDGSHVSVLTPFGVSGQAYIRVYSLTAYCHANSSIIGATNAGLNLGLIGGPHIL